jgi:DNA-binding SARP family transcriptional activator
LSEFRVLGPVEAAVDGNPVRLPASKPRALLALLLLNRNRVVSTEQLIDGLWDDPPETAAKALQGYVSQLRRALGAERVETRPPG